MNLTFIVFCSGLGLAAGSARGIPAALDLILVHRDRAGWLLISVFVAGLATAVGALIAWVMA